ncbi:hypothetical protein [Algibacter mikhailovii]|uniref:Uncharacterized protein n=1 Tax=Algibacter mikhailovii TaxID=425498 RepID=A0A918QX55_9FLAO|nr:hypothetical protein [Algibacter mikhailovii]GGZ72496.1 hypothetical protein GCM10007028_06900 [Algibacter mikhailovii]
MKRIKLRLQDLTRQQAYGVQGRLILRIFPLYKFKKEVEYNDIELFYDKLFDFTHLLFDVALGNVLIENALEEAKESHEFFMGYSNKIISKNRPTLEPVLLTIDALGQLNLVDFFEKPGLANKDKGLADLDMSIAMAALAISQYGLGDSLIYDSVENDCKFIFDNNKDVQFLDADFFKQKLWILNESVLTEDTGMNFVFEKIILEDWKNGLFEMRLEGIFSSYQNRIYGLNLIKKNKSNLNSKTVINNVTINLGEGATFTGPVSVGENIKSSFTIASKLETEELKTNLQELIKQVGKLIESIDSQEEKEAVSEQLKTLVEEANKDKPSKWLIEVSSKGILKASKAFVDLVSPISTIVKNVLSIIEIS